MNIKSKLEIYGNGQEQKTVCRKCFEKYQTHEQVDHITCFFLIQNGGGLDVRPPKTIIKERNKSLIKVRDPK